MKMAAEAVRLKTASSQFGSTRHPSTQLHSHKLPTSTFLACASLNGKNKAYNELGLFALKKKIEDVVLRTELIATAALEHEEARRIEQEEMIRNHDLWDDPSKSNDILVDLVHSARAVDTLKDLTYRAEEAKLIAQLAEIGAVNYSLFKQAYTASLDVSKSLERYQMLQLLNDPYDVEGASLVIKAKSNDTNHQQWAEQLLTMYTKWGEKQCRTVRTVEKCLSANGGGISSATIEFEFEYAYGYLQGERGIHRMIRGSEQESSMNQLVSAAAVDVIPLFLGANSELHIDEEDITTLPTEEDGARSKVAIQHVPTGIVVESSGERSQLANKIKAKNRLKARLLVIAKDQQVTNVRDIRRDDIFNVWNNEVRRYISYPTKFVRDERSCLELRDLGSVLDGNIEPFIGAHLLHLQTHA